MRRWHASSPSLARRRRSSRHRMPSGIGSPGWSRPAMPQASKIYRNRYREGIPRRPIERGGGRRAHPLSGACEVGGPGLVGPARRAPVRYILPGDPGIDPCFGLSRSLRSSQPGMWAALAAGEADAAGPRNGLRPLSPKRARALCSSTSALRLRGSSPPSRSRWPLGAAIGYLMGRVTIADRLGDPWLIVLLNLPALVIIVLAYIWAGLTEAAAIAAIAINKLPNAVVTIREGTRALDPGLDEMSRSLPFLGGRRFATSCCRSLLPTSPQRRVPACRWCGRSCLSPSCWAGRTAWVSRSALLSSCSTSRVSLPMRWPSRPSCWQSKLCWCNPLNDARPAGDPALLDVRIVRKAYTTASGDRLEVLRDIAFTLRPGRNRCCRRSLRLRQDDDAADHCRPRSPTTTGRSCARRPDRHGVPGAENSARGAPSMTTSGWWRHTSTRQSAQLCSMSWD